MKRSDFLYICLSLSVWFLMNIPTSMEINCKDEDNQDVDWFIVYKLPTIEDKKEGTYLRDGRAYAYLTSGKNRKWTLSSYSIDSKESIIAKTWQDFKDTKNKGSDIAYLFYNDQPPDGYNGTAVGHLKGYFAFDSETGFWLIHSVPGFGAPQEYEYPHSARRYGQTALCVTYDTPSLNEICHHLLYCNPNIYDYKISRELLHRVDKVARTIFTSDPDFKKDGFLTRETNLISKDNEQFIAFAKDNQLKIDIYSELLTNYLRTNLLVETWIRGNVDYSHPGVQDIKSIKMTSDGGDIYFKSKEDHSKWAISTKSSSKWVCIADLNRMISQKKRGGGAVCFISKPVWTAFNSIVDDTTNRKGFFQQTCEANTMI